MSESVRINKKSCRAIDSRRGKHGFTKTGFIDNAVFVYSRLLDAHEEGSSIIIEAKDGSRTKVLI